MNTGDQPTGIDKAKMKVRQQIFYLLLQITELYPDKFTARHLAGILRRKDDKGPEFFFWDDNELLNHIEQYKEELDNEIVVTEDETDE